MMSLRVGLITLLSCLFCQMAQADVRPLNAVQTLNPPASPVFTTWGQDVAIDGGYIIVIGAYNGGQQALLYRRSNATGQWSFRRALLTWTGPFVRGQVAMKNGIAAIQFGNQISLFELSGGDYVLTSGATPLLHQGGLAISGNTVLIGGDDCDYDAVMYQKNTSGSWAITGRIDDGQGLCFTPSENYAVELNYDYAILRAPDGREGRLWRRIAGQVNWVYGGQINFTPQEVVTADTAFALQGATAVAPNGGVWRRSGVNTWVRQGTLTTVDEDDSINATYNVVYRDGVLVTSEPGKYLAFPRVYVEASPGRFEHVGSMPFFDVTGSQLLDVSGRTVVVTARDYGPSRQLVRVFNLHQPLRAPPPVVNDFEDRDASDFTTSGGQFAIVARGTNDVLAQSSPEGLAVALFNDTDWTDYQRVEADINYDTLPTGSWVGLVARYVDADNYYYLAVRGNRTYAIYKRVNGVETLLFQGSFYNTETDIFRATLRVIGDQVDVYFSFQQGHTVTDRSLTHGRGGVATYLARADFDAVHVAPADEYGLFSREWGYTGTDNTIGMNRLSGTWSIGEGGDEEVQYLTGLQQSDASGSAVAVIGTPVGNQQIHAVMRVDSYAASTSGAWVGLLARYTDARNHYYVTIRSSGQIQIRKLVNGVITVLATAPFVPTLGQYYAVDFRVINDQLTVHVDQALVASAHDADIASGRYGIATYRATANWDSFVVIQP